MKKVFSIFKWGEALNDTQKNILEGTFKFYFDDLASELNPYEILSALRAMKCKIVSPKDISIFKEKNIWETIEQVRGILLHPCPQNRNVGDYNAACKASNKRRVSKDGVIDGEVYYYTNGRDSEIEHEPQGCLGLTARNDFTAPAVTREAVVGFIHKLINDTILEYQKKMNIDENHSVRSCLDCNELITDSSWLVCLLNDEQNKQSILYIEGLGEDGELFLDQYQIVANTHGLIAITVRSIFPRVFDGEESIFQIFKINELQGYILRDNLRLEVKKYVEKADSFLSFFKVNAYPEIDCSTAWVIEQLAKIYLFVDRAIFKSQSENSCAIM